jgi:hypothetical protein
VIKNSTGFSKMRFEVKRLLAGSAGAAGAALADAWGAADASGSVAVAPALGCAWSGCAREACGAEAHAAHEMPAAISKDIEIT